MILTLAKGSPVEAQAIARWSIGEYLLALEVYVEEMERRKGIQPQMDE